MNIAVIPHNDDESLFLAYTLIREKPLVLLVTDSFIQPNRGDVGCTAEIRRNETIRAMEILKCPVVFLGIKDTELTEENFRQRIQFFTGFEKVYIPAVQGGNPQHDLIGKVGREVFSNAVSYTTYTRTELYTRGTIEVIPTPEEVELKERALWCYQSQINLPSTRPHFEAVLGGKSEWLK
jgi:LmbE family N-acetylglucosaminyl deacetylase